MFLTNSLFGLNDLIFAAVEAGDYQTQNCVFSGLCIPSINPDANFQNAISELVNYFVSDPDGLSKAILAPCQVFAGLGTLYMLTPILIDISKLDRGINYNKIVLFFMLMILFVNNGDYGRKIAFANYAFIKGIHNALVQQVNQPGSTMTLTTSKYMGDVAKVLAIIKQVEICRSYPSQKGQDANNAPVPNPTFDACEAKLRNMISNASFSNPTTTSIFALALAEQDFINMARRIFNASIGFPIEVTRIMSTDKPKVTISGNDKDHLVSWYAGLAIMPDIALVAALLFFPVPLAFCFINTSYLQAWLTGIWAVGFFQFAMTIFTLNFQVVQNALGPSIPADTVTMVMAIALPSMAIALATGSGLGLSSLISQGVMNLSQSKQTPPVMNQPGRK